jgi:hypothetical protein
MNKKITKQNLKNYILSEVTKIYKIEFLSERKKHIEKELNILNEENEVDSRSVEYGINPYQEQPDMDSVKLDAMKQHLEWLESMIMNYDRAMMYDKKDEVEQQYYKLSNEISNLEQDNQLPF